MNIKLYEIGNYDIYYVLLLGFTTVAPRVGSGKLPSGFGKIEN